MRRVVISLAVAAWPALAGCSSGSSPAAAAPESAKPATTAAVASPVDGTWRSTKIYEAQFVRWYIAAGGRAEDGSGNPYPSVTAAGKAFFAQLGTGAHRYALIILRFESGFFTELESGDGGQAVVGDRQTYTVTGDRMAMEDQSGTCDSAYTLRVTGRRLRLHVLKQCAMGWFGTVLWASFPFMKAS